MKATKAPSWVKMAASLEFSTLQSISRGMKTRRDSTATGNTALSLDGCHDNPQVSDRKRKC